MEGPSNKKANTPAYAESRPLWNRQIAGSNMYSHVGWPMEASKNCGYGPAFYWNRLYLLTFAKDYIFPNHKDLGIPIRSKHPSKL